MNFFIKKKLRENFISYFYFQRALILGFKVEGAPEKSELIGNIPFTLPVNWTFVPYFHIGLGGRHEWVLREGLLLSGTPNEVLLNIKCSDMSLQGNYWKEISFSYG